MNKGLLMIFVKNPVKGQVKTRLAADTGDQKALEIYQDLLQHTKSIVADLPYPKKVYYSHFIEPDDIWEAPGFSKALQPTGDLGVKMATSFQANLKDSEKVVIIGSDCPDITQEHLEEAFAALDHHDFVIGPAKDGGYYLLGMKNFLAEVFTNKSWSTDQVLQETIQTLEKHGLTYYQLPMLNDIDNYADLLESKWYREQAKRTI